MEWKFYFGACFLTAAMLTPFAGVQPVVAGMLLAGVICFGLSLLNGPR